MSWGPGEMGDGILNGKTEFVHEYMQSSFRLLLDIINALTEMRGQVRKDQKLQNFTKKLMTKQHLRYTT